MDGAVVLATDGTRIVRAGVQLMPDPTHPHRGVRHPAPHRGAGGPQTGFPVISVSQSMRIIGLYVDGRRYVLEDSAAILSRANQALATLERYKLRLDEVAGTLSALEIEDLVTVRDAISVAQRLEMVRRIADEIEGYVVELGTDGRLLACSWTSCWPAWTPTASWWCATTCPAAAAGPARVEDVAGRTGRALASRAARPRRGRAGARAAHPREALDAAVSPRGYRLLAKVPRLPGAISTGWSSTSAACRSCWPRASTTCRRSRGSARPGPARSGRACPGWPSRRSWSGTCRTACRGPGLVAVRLVAGCGLVGLWAPRSGGWSGRGRARGAGGSAQAVRPGG